MAPHENIPYSRNANYSNYSNEMNHDRIPYQVDYTHVVSGKHFQYSKRRVKFIFGFASESALEAGCTGPDCRGDEHEVVLVWSWTSGKQLVLLDGKEILRSAQRNGLAGTVKFDHTFFMGNHVLILSGVSSIIPSLDPAKQFDLKVDGRSFFSMRKIYELCGYEKSYSSTRKKTLEKEEERLLQMAKQISLEENIEVKLNEQENKTSPQSQQKHQQHQQNAQTQQSPYYQVYPNQAYKSSHTPVLVPPAPPAYYNPTPTLKPTYNRIPSFHPQEPTVMSFMQPAPLARFNSNGFPYEVCVPPDDAPTYKTPQPQKLLKNSVSNLTDTEEPWEVLVDFASIKDGGDNNSIQTDGYSKNYPTHDYFEYYKDYVKRGGEALPHPAASPITTPPNISQNKTINSYFDPFANNNNAYTNASAKTSQEIQQPLQHPNLNGYSLSSQQQNNYYSHYSHNAATYPHSTQHQYHQYLYHQQHYQQQHQQQPLQNPMDVHTDTQQAHISSHYYQY